MRTQPLITAASVTKENTILIKNNRPIFVRDVDDEIYTKNVAHLDLYSLLNMQNKSTLNLYKTFLQGSKAKGFIN